MQQTKQAHHGMTHNHHLHTAAAMCTQAPANLSLSVTRDNLGSFATACCQSAAGWRAWPSSTSNCSILHRRERACVLTERVAKMLRSTHAQLEPAQPTS